MSSSRRASTRAKSLLIDFLLTQICLPEGDNPRAAATRRMNHNHYSPGHDAKRDQPRLAVVKPTVLECDASAFEHQLHILEGEPVLLLVGQVLLLVPFEQ